MNAKGPPFSAFASDVLGLRMALGFCVVVGSVPTVKLLCLCVCRSGGVGMDFEFMFGL